MGIFNFKKVSEEKLKEKETNKPNPLSYLKEDVSEKLQQLNNNIYNEEEAKKQIQALMEHLPITRQEDEFRDDLRRELYLLGYERQCDNGEEELAEEVALTDLEVDILEKINAEILAGNLVPLKKSFVVKNIFRLMDRLKPLMSKDEVSSAPDKSKGTEIDIIKIIEDMESERE